MSNPSGRKGSSWEAEIVKYLRGVGLEAERLPKAGAKDCGDIVVRIGGLPFVLEAKNRKKIDLAAATKEAALEAQHFAEARGVPVPHFASVIKRRQYGVASAYVVVPLAEYLRQVLPTDAP